jgi:transcriptional regulator with XRE-family HTH domain/tetratricopeptide (TPR) repeat protein
MQRMFLREARELKGWTLEEAAEEVGVTRNTVWRWEQGISTPYTYHTDRICRAYGLSRAELGLPDHNPRKGPPGRVKPLLKSADAEQQALEAACTRLASLIGDDLHLRLSYLMDDWLLHARFTGSLADLQGQVSREVESYDRMNTQDHPNHLGIDEGRRAALRTLALIPLQALGLGIVASSTKPAWAPEEVLPHCAAGIIACYHLAKGQYEDMALASDAITGYLPTLQKIVKESSTYRQQAAHLAAQCWLLKATLAVHSESPQKAAADIQQALTYAETSEDLPLQLAILHRQVWIAICGGQPGSALNAALQMQSLLVHPTMPLSPLILSSAYGGIAKGHASNRRQQEAQAALSQLYDTPTEITGDENLVYLGYDGPAYYAGQTHYYLRQYNEAFAAFAKIVDPQTQTLKLPLGSERSRIETINHMTLAALKRPNKDKDLIVPLWTAGMQGARNLQSQQRYEEAQTAYGIMEALWSDDPTIRDLRDLMEHW